MNIKKVMSLMAVSSMLVACGGGTGGSSATELKDGDTIKIGFVGPLTGETSTYGIPVKNTIELAIEDYNNSDDAKYKVELLAEDSQGKETDAVNAYKKLVGEKVVGIVGPVITAEGLALGEASKADGTPIVSPSTSGDSITLNNDGSTRSNYFRTCSNDSMGGQTIATAIGDGRINVKKVAILTNSFVPCNGRFPMLISIAAIFIGGISVGIKESFISALTVTVVIILGVLMTLLVSKILSKTILKGMPSNFILELPPYRKPQVGKVIVRSIFDRTLYVLGRAIAIAAPAGAVIWIFSNIMIGDASILTICANYLSPLANAIGVDGYILMAFILGLPANEIVMPIIIMSYLRATTMLELDNLYELKELLVANGWTILTAINVMILCLMHYPCGTTLWTIKQETKSFKWTALSFLIPTVAGIVICFITTQIWRLFA